MRQKMLMIVCLTLITFVPSVYGTTLWSDNFQSYNPGAFSGQDTSWTVTLDSGCAANIVDTAGEKVLEMSHDTTMWRHAKVEKDLTGIAAVSSNTETEITLAWDWNTGSSYGGYISLFVEDDAGTVILELKRDHNGLINIRKPDGGLISLDFPGRVDAYYPYAITIDTVADTFDFKYNSTVSSNNPLLNSVDLDPDSLGFVLLDSYSGFGIPHVFKTDNFVLSAVPEPATLCLLFFGALGIAQNNKRKK